MAGAPGPRGVSAAAAVTWAFGGASGQAQLPLLPSGGLRARAPTWRLNSAACGHAEVRAATGVLKPGDSLPWIPGQVQGPAQGDGTRVWFPGSSKGSSLEALFQVVSWGLLRRGEVSGGGCEPAGAWDPAGGVTGGLGVIGRTCSDLGVTPGPGGEWGPWSPCSVPCGGGYRNRTRGSSGPSPVDFSTCGLQPCVGGGTHLPDELGGSK